MEKLFSYGTLQLARVQTQLFNRELHGQKDSLTGYKLVEITITDQAVIDKSGTTIHPILVATGNPADEVSGTVFLLSAVELQQADAYEVAEYTRIKARCKSGGQAWIYTAAD